MSSTVATLIEHSSRMGSEEDADPLMLLYRTLDVHTPDIARVVLAIHDLRMLAKHMDERLTPYLLEDTHGYDYAIASLLSVNGKGLKYLTTTTQAFSITERSGGGVSQGMKELMTGEKRTGQEPGIALPE